MQQLNIFHRTLHRQASTQRVVVNGCKEDITNTTYIFVKFSFFFPQLTHTRNWITHQKKVSSSSPHTYNKIFLSLQHECENYEMVHTERRKIYNQNISPGIHLFQLFFCTYYDAVCATTTTGESDKKTFTSLLHFCDVCRNYMTCERRGERGRQQKKDEECSINYWIFLLKT